MGPSVATRATLNRPGSQAGATAAVGTAVRTAGRGGVVPFLLGTAVGGVAGGVVGGLLSDHVVHLVGGMVGVADRRSSGDDEPRFDLLLQ